MPPSTRRLTGSLLGVPEPAPAQFLVRRPSYPWLVVGTTCVAAFIGQVDASIVQLALPTLEGAFHSGLATVSWVAVGYVLASASILPVFARIAEIAGRKLMYLFGFALFGIASMLCGLAPDLPLLILFRVLQGISGAMLGANSIVILVAAAGPERRGRAMGVFAAAQAVGISAGPALGGLILSMLSWRWLFWVNVPFALCAVAIGWLVVPLTQQTENDRRFDLPGALLLIPALITLLTAIMQSQAWGLISVGTITCIVAAVVLFIAFIVEKSDASAVARPEFIPRCSLLWRVRGRGTVLRDAVWHVLRDGLCTRAWLSRPALGGGAAADNHPTRARHRGAVQRCLV